MFNNEIQEQTSITEPFVPRINSKLENGLFPLVHLHCRVLSRVYSFNKNKKKLLYSSSNTKFTTLTIIVSTITLKSVHFDPGMGI